MDTNIAKKQLKQQQHYNKRAKELGHLHKGDRGKIQPFDLGKKWIDGEVKREVRPCSYKVEANSRIYIRNCKHLWKCRLTPDSEVDEDTSMPEADQSTNTELQETQEEPKELKPQMELDVEFVAPQEDEGYRT